MNAHAKRLAAMLIPGLAAAVLLAASPARASIPDADIRARVNRAGFGVVEGAYGHVDYGLSDRSALGMYVGVDPNDVYFNDYSPGDDHVGSDAVIGGHYMYQFVEGVDGNPSVAGIFGAFANRAALRPEVGIGVSYPFAQRWVGRLNAVYGPSWGAEVGYRFTPQVEGTFGITGMGLFGLGLRF